MADFFEAVPGQSFRDFDDWVSRARWALTDHPEFFNAEHAKVKGWRGNHFVALCFDQAGRRCKSGGDMARARDEGKFPVWWVWPDQIAEALIAAAVVRVPIIGKVE